MRRNIKMPVQGEKCCTCWRYANCILDSDHILTIDVDDELGGDFSVLKENDYIVLPTDVNDINLRYLITNERRKLSHINVIVPADAQPYTYKLEAGSLIWCVGKEIAKFNKEPSIASIDLVVPENYIMAAKFINKYGSQLLNKDILKQQELAKQNHTKTDRYANFNQEYMYNGLSSLYIIHKDKFDSLNKDGSMVKIDRLGCAGFSMQISEDVYYENCALVEKVKGSQPE